MFENKHQPLASVPVYRHRIAKNFGVGILIIFICLLAGTAGYHFTSDVAWLDAFHNACMILSGMGPVVEMKTDSGKLFSSFYALCSGMIFIANIGFILAPTIHRFFHKLHLDQQQ